MQLKGWTLTGPDFLIFKSCFLTSLKALPLRYVLWTGLLKLNECFKRFSEYYREGHLWHYQSSEWVQELFKFIRQKQLPHTLIHALSNHVEEFMRIHGSILSHLGIGRGLLIPWDTSYPFPSGERGTDVVGQPHVKMKWEIPSKDRDRHSDGFRCIPYRMGCNLLSTEDQRSLVSWGKRNVNQLPGAACSYFRSQDICEEAHSSISDITHREHNSGSIYKQQGGYSLCRAGSSGSKPLDVVPGENIHITPQYLPWVQNTIPNAESWTTVDRFDWKLNLNLYSLVDLFVSRLTAQGPVYFS